jgi:LuxR family transcriptional regulator
MSKKFGIDFHLQKLRNIASAGYAIELNIRSTEPTLSLRTYPVEWIKYYTSNGYMLSDPVISWGITQSGTCRWRDMDVPDPRNVMVHARKYGLNHGIVVSHGEIESRTVAGFAKSDREFSDAEIAICLGVVERLHAETKPPDRLTDAQIEALRLIGSGGRHAQVAAELGISESALKARLKSARNRLMARTTAEAIQRATEFNLM